MARRHHYRRRTGDPPELDMTTFLNLMVVLVPFLLITAVFSRITIVELSLPSAAEGAVAGASNAAQWKSDIEQRPLAELRKMLHAWRARVAAGMMAPNPSYDPSTYPSAVQR